MATVHATAQGRADVSPTGRGIFPAGTWRSAWPALLVIASFLPLLALHARMLWARPHYQFFPLVFPGAIALAWQRCRGLGPLQPAKGKVAGLLAFVGWCLLAFGVLFLSPLAAAVGALVTLLGGIYGLGGRPLVRQALPAWAFLWLTIPLPRRYDLMLVTGLQDLVSRWSSQFLDILGVFHVMEGNVVEVTGRRLLVDQACSGIYSLLTLMLGALFYTLWVRASVPRSLCLLASAVFWVIAGNVARIVSMVVLATRYDIDATVGKKHEALGMAIFVLMLVMVASTDRFYTFVSSIVKRIWSTITRPASRPKSVGEEASKVWAAAVAAANASTDPAERHTVLADPRRSWVGRFSTGLAFGALLIPQYAMPGVDWREALLVNDFYDKGFAKLDEQTLPNQIGGLQRVGFEVLHRKMDDSWGENSRVWSFRGGGANAAASVDHQFVDWHELTVCYQSNGWTMEERTVGAPAGSEIADGESVVIARFSNPAGYNGYLIFGLYGRDGRPSPPPESLSVVKSLMNRLSGWIRPGSRSQHVVARLNHQIQFFVESESAFDTEQIKTFFKLYDQFRRTVQAKGLGVEIAEAGQ
ncbi:MAG: exosortase U [Isosphaeraceae bacterium]